MVKLEKLIAERFDVLADTFPSFIEKDDARLGAILRNAGDIAGKRVLEVGCGKGRVSRIFKDQGADIYGVDVSEKLLQEAKNISPFSFIKAEAYQMPFKDDTFDIVVMLEVFEHIPDPHSALREITRVLKNDGKLIVVDRNKFSLNNRRFLVPNLLIKRYHELKNEWMYPKDFPYRERWFDPGRVHRTFRRYFKDAGYEYIISDGERKRWWHFVFKLVPQTRHFVLWHGRRKHKRGEKRQYREGKRAVVKEFGAGHLRVREKVAETPGMRSPAGTKSRMSGIFTLRIDADEYEEKSFSGYSGLFEKYKDAITIFFNVNSFKNAAGEIKKCKQIGLDIQSHGFYHHTYSDYKSNRYNIRKAKVFFENLGVRTKGFASPMGRWNLPLMRALEDEGYAYSSDFAYDYLSLPTRPSMDRRYCGILEIPVFPVAPELFFQKRQCEISDVLGYYKSAIDEMIDCGLPVIIYAHTSVDHGEIPKLLEKIVDYAVPDKGLSPKNMTEVHDHWQRGVDHENGPAGNIVSVKTPHPDFWGRPVNEPFYRKMKDRLKDIIDFERITPVDELRCNRIKKAMKILARNIL